jgi:DNA-directed RNA polymerase specialized sigma24 family protein
MAFCVIVVDLLPSSSPIEERRKKMSYNYAKELAKWTKWKEQEEQLLRSLNVEEKIIKQLHEYDWEAFKADRRIRRKQNVTLDRLFYSIPYYDKKDILTVEDLLDEIENEALLHYLSQTDQVTLNIILLKMLGYSTKEISEILKISPSKIYKRIQRLRKKLK